MGWVAGREGLLERDGGGGGVAGGGVRRWALLLELLELLPELELLRFELRLFLLEEAGGGGGGVG